MIPMVCCFSCTPATPIKPIDKPHEHTFANEYSHDETKHWQNATCEHTELTQNLGEHTFVNGVCSVCNYVKEVTHEHTFSEIYSYDETSHWQVATCEHTTLTQNFGSHTFIDGFCSVCGMAEPEPDPEPHVHTFNIDYEHDETMHWQSASCEHSELSQNLDAHNFVNGVCETCGYIDPHSIVIYDEEVDEIDEESAKDLSHLYDAFESIGKNYTLTNRSHFTDSALALYNKDYKKEFSQQTTRLVNDKYLYTYSNDENYSSLNQYNKLYLFDDGGVSLDYPNVDILNVESYEPNKQTSDGLVPFMLSDINSTYIGSHKFERVSKYKYICKEESVINDFLDLCCPYLDNKGYYMTYDRVSIEVDNYDAITRIRIYASITQSGKLTSNYLNQEYVNWYLMFNETIVKDIGHTVIKSLENNN